LALRNTEWVDLLCREEGLPDAYRDTVFDVVAPLAADIRHLHADAARPLVVGIAGAQGSGKSTLSLFLSNWLQRQTDLSAVCLSLDDFYLGSEARQVLARNEHALFATRGVPGTHDTRLAMHVLRSLTDSGNPAQVALPEFDKAIDDRRPDAATKVVAAPVDIVLFEGWCVGARPQAEEKLVEPVNSLEATEDPDGVWRSRVNEYLAADYAKLFERLDTLIMLRVPSFAKVLEWRGLQERKLRESAMQQPDGSANAAGQTDLQIARFVMHYERLTRHMLESMPATADTLIDVDDEHRLVSIQRKH
jgi:D-glycerate 3-kinase